MSHCFKICCFLPHTTLFFFPFCTLFSLLSRHRGLLLPLLSATTTVPSSGRGTEPVAGGIGYPGPAGAAAESRSWAGGSLGPLGTAPLIAGDRVYASPVSRSGRHQPLRHQDRSVASLLCPRSCREGVSAVWALLRGTRGLCCSRAGLGTLGLGASLGSLTQVPGCCKQLHHVTPFQN